MTTTTKRPLPESLYAAREHTITQTEAHERFTRRNTQGLGYAPYTDVPGADDVSGAVEAAEADGWHVIHERTNDTEVAVLANDDGELLAIGDANGPWAVDISACIEIGS